MHILLQTIQWLCILRWFYLWVKICSSHCSLFAFYSTHTEPTHKLYEFVLFVCLLSAVNWVHRISKYISTSDPKMIKFTVFIYINTVLECYNVCVCVYVYSVSFVTFWCSISQLGTCYRFTFIVALCLRTTTNKKNLPSIW